MSDSIRQQKVAGVLQRDLSEIFQLEGKSIFNGAFITVTQVRVTPDLGLAKVYLSIFNPGEKGDALELIRSKSAYIRGKLGQRIKNQLRHVPELNFYLDDSLDYAEKIDDLLKK